MKTIQSIFSSALLSLVLAAGAAFAQGAHHHNHGSKAEASSAAADMADGEVRKINKTSGKVTLKHGDIKSIDMPPMTMVFGVADKAMLDGIAEGDKVKFNVKKDGSNYVVTEIKKAP